MKKLINYSRKSKEVKDKLMESLCFGSKYSKFILFMTILHTVVLVVTDESDHPNT